MATKAKRPATGTPSAEARREGDAGTEATDPLPDALSPAGHAQWIADYGCGLDDPSLRFAAAPTLLLHRLDVKGARLAGDLRRIIEDACMKVERDILGATLPGSGETFGAVLAQMNLPAPLLDELPIEPTPRPAPFLIAEAASDGRPVIGPLIRRKLARVEAIRRALEAARLHARLLAEDDYQPDDPPPTRRGSGRPEAIDADRVRLVARWLARHYRRDRPEAERQRPHSDLHADVLAVCRHYGINLGTDDTPRALDTIRKAVERGRT